MTRSKPKIQKKLEKVVLATLMFAGAVQLAMNPSVVEAFTITVEDANDPLSVTGMATSGYYYSPNSAECTELKITGGTASYLYAGFQDYFSNGADVSGHTITVDGATVGAVVGGLGFSSANVENNTVNIVSGTVNSAYGGLISSPGVSTAYVNNNTVNVSGGTVTSTVYGGRSEADANYNTVNISGGTVNQYIYGGQSTYGTTASNNTVTIKGDAVLGPSAVIYGGHATKYGGSSVTYGTASDNTVNILTPIKIMGLYGGLGDTSKSTGNTLNIAAVGVKVESSSGSAVKYFQNINFFLPKGSAGQTMLTIENGNGNDLDGVTIGAAVLEGSDLKKDDTVTLIKKDTGVGNVTLSNTTNGNVTFLAANNLKTDTEYELSLSKTDTAIEAKVEKVRETSGDTSGESNATSEEKRADDRLKSPVETRAGVVTMINAGADLLVGQGMSNAAEAAAEEHAGNNAEGVSRSGGFAPFAAVSVGKMRAESGSHVDTKGIGLNLGFAREIENKSGKLLVGPVVEYGHGSYDSYQDNGIKADGKSSYWGIGVIAKQTNHNGFYYEGSIRGGRTKSDYGSDNLSAAGHVSYDSNSTYWAAHLGAGKLVDIGHSNTLDYYGKYFYSHTGSDSTTIHIAGTNETANFDAVNSHRIRLGARITHALNAKNKIYGGLAWQYEFNGDARAVYSVSGEAPSPSVKGSSGMMELGWQVKPGKSPMTMDLGVTGWVGKQRGITANLQANWTF